jgi:hypothetical protein
MKVNIGPYKNFYNIYSFIMGLTKFGFSEETCYKITDKLEDSFVQSILDWFNKNQKRKIEIKIDPWDTWNMDHTLAHIIYPMLVQLKETSHGAFSVENDDVPVNLHCVEQDDYGTDKYYFLRYQYILDEMIWTFDKIRNDEYRFDFTTEMYRIKNGLRLFGKYYLGLWD